VHARSIFVTFPFALVMTAGALLSSGLFPKLSAEDLRSSTAPSSAAMTRQEVWRAVVTDLGHRGLAQQQLPQAEDLDVPVALPALAGRKLRVLSACWDEGPRRTQLRLECGTPAECLPFLVYLHQAYPGNGGGTRNGNGDAGQQEESCRPASGPVPVPRAMSPPMVRPGDRARAVFLGNGLRMTASVTCLERGRRGEVIRVRAVDGHIFRARISGPALLEALPR